MRTEQIEIYKFEDLSEEAREKAIEDLREHNNNDNHYFLEEELNELLKEELDENNIKHYDDLKLYYSFSYSQGDGLCFIGNFRFKDFEFGIKHNSNYYHKNSTEIWFIDEFQEEDNLSEIVRQKAIEKAEEEFKEIYSKICDKLEKIGYEAIEYENSEENLKELIEANEYEFLENGEQF